MILYLWGNEKATEIFRPDASPIKCNFDGLAEPDANLNKIVKDVIKILRIFNIKRNLSTAMSLSKKSPQPLN